MPEIGIRELKTKTSQVVRNVHKRHTRYVVTLRGRPVAMLVPLDSQPPVTPASSKQLDDVWNELTRLGKLIAESWPPGTDSGEVLSDMRR